MYTEKIEPKLPMQKTGSTATRQKTMNTRSANTMR